MPVWLTDNEHAVVAAAADRLIPPLDGHPGARAAGVADYIDHLLGAFTFDPPHIWAGGPYSGRAGGKARFGEFLPLSRLEELAWRTRIEGSLGRPERERNGPVTGLQEQYRDGLRALGADFCAVDLDEQDARLARVPDFRTVLYEHACEGTYGAPEYGGNRDAVAWSAIAYPGDVQPRGYTEQEVTGRE
ncbi:MAG TPA: gluconate 2-dehydrogenase subunit 3 family protein [Acidimicrobiia bacterium]|jgi:hypothetical protein